MSCKLPVAERIRGKYGLIWNQRPEPETRSQWVTSQAEYPLGGYSQLPFLTPWTRWDLNEQHCSFKRLRQIEEREPRKWAETTCIHSLCARAIIIFSCIILISYPSPPKNLWFLTFPCVCVCISNTKQNKAPQNQGMALIIKCQPL